MKTYVVVVEINEGSDEFWEEVGRAKLRDAKKMVRDEVLSCLADHGFVRPHVRASTALVRREVRS